MRSRLAAFALSMVAGSAGLTLAQTIEFRFVERTGQTSIGIGGDNVLSLAVQGRLVGAAADAALTGYAFDIVLQGEPDSFGTLAKERGSNNDHTIYTGAPALNSTVGRGGIPFQYCYLAGISASFNGNVNFSVGTFTNTPGNQEIGLITGSCSGNAFLGTPGIDVWNGDLINAIPAENPCDQGGAPRADCNPDTWNALRTWDSSVTPPSAAPMVMQGDVATIDPAVGPVYLGVGGGWVDLYRFRYTATNTTPRTLTLTLARAGGSRASQFVFSNGSWGPAAITTPVTVTDLVIPVGNPGACCDAGGSCVATVDTGCAGGSTFVGGASCSPSPCASACCNGSSCAVVTAGACSGTFHAGAACGSGPGNPTTCCEANFDGVGGVQVKDIFDWINAWFMQDPRTDANHSGTLELFDIFAFLQLWFGGCA